MTGSFLSTPVKGKIIIASVIACIALSLAWYVSKFTFREMLRTVENISSPNDKLTIVNNLSRGITRLDQLQRTMTLDRQTYNTIFFKEFRQLALTLDTLELLYRNNPLQSKRIHSMTQMLLQRNQLFINYLGVRKKIINNEVLSEQVESLNGILSSRSQDGDSTRILTTEKKVSTTTVFPSEEEGARGLFGKIFGKKKRFRSSQDKVINEELNITVDTIQISDNDTTLKEVKQAVLDIERKQLQQSKSFVTRETQLGLASNKLTSQMLNILQEVEAEVMSQSAASHRQARQVVNASVKHINIILIIFLLVTATLLYLILTDISKSNSYRKELELAKDEAEYHGMAKQRFLSNMSHEIRTPLQAIIGYTELIRQGYTDKPNIDAVYHSSMHLLQIVNEILDYSRIISGKFSFNNSAFNLKELLEEVVSVMRLPAKEKSLNLLTDLDLSPLELIKGDAFRLRQIIYNLLSNAIKFTDAGNITLGASCKHHKENAHLMLTVHDTGIGIADEDLKGIFNEFDQGGVSENTASGSGLGLSIVKALVESQGGRIYVKTEVGKGSCFTLYLKFEIAEKQYPAVSDLPVKSSLVKGKVWVVDDDGFILQLCSAILENNDIKHRCFDSPENVLNTPWDDGVSYVLLDIRMPGMNGIELCSLLKTRIPADVKIYALTAQALSQEYAEVLQHGFDALLMKPFSEGELLSLIKADRISTEEVIDHNYIPDFDSLQKMTFGDEIQIRKILERFTADSRNDINELKIAMQNQNTEKTTLLLHRIAGRTAQIGSKQLALDFRRLELASQKGIIDEQQRAMIKENVKNLIRLADHIKNVDTIRS